MTQTEKEEVLPLVLPSEGKRHVIKCKKCGSIFPRPHEYDVRKLQQGYRVIHAYGPCRPPPDFRRGELQLLEVPDNDEPTGRNTDRCAQYDNFPRFPCPSSGDW